MQGSHKYFIYIENVQTLLQLVRYNVPSIQQGAALLYRHSAASAITIDRRRNSPSPWSSTGFSVGATPIYYLPPPSGPHVLALWYPFSLLC